MEEEQAAIDAAVNAGRQPSYAYEKLGDSLSRKWIEATGGAKASDPSHEVLLNPGRYMALAFVNMDQFAGDAVASYIAGHTHAMKQAAQLHEEDFTQPAVRQALLSCYAMNTFADLSRTTAAKATAGSSTPNRYARMSSIVLVARARGCLHPRQPAPAPLLRPARGRAPVGAHR
jgi:hypothetical protein